MFNRNIFKKKEDKEKTKEFICQGECDKIKEENERKELERLQAKRREEKIKKALDELDEKERKRKELQRVIELQEQEEWVYVEGIKGMTEDMKMILNM